MTLEEAKMTIYANCIYACEKAGFDLSTICMVDDALRTVIAIADRKTESSSEKPNNCECEPRKEQNFCGKCRYLYRDFKYGLSCYRLMDNEPCKYEARKTEDSSMVDKDINVRSKDEPQTERGGRDEYKVL